MILEHHRGLPPTPRLHKSRMSDRTSSPSHARVNLACAKCKTRVSSKSYILSWAFRGFTGKGALFAKVYEDHLVLSTPSILLMNSGAHTVQEFSCITCGMKLGWKIIRAFEWPEKWKEGGAVLELDLLVEEPGSPLSQELHMEAEMNYRDPAEVPETLSVPSTPKSVHSFKIGRPLSDTPSLRSRPNGPRVHSQRLMQLQAS